MKLEKKNNENEKMHEAVVVKKRGHLLQGQSEGTDTGKPMTWFHLNLNEYWMIPVDVMQSTLSERKKLIRNNQQPQ